MSAQGHEETRRPRDPRGRFSSVTGRPGGLRWGTCFQMKSPKSVVFVVAVLRLWATSLCVGSVEPASSERAHCSSIASGVLVDNAELFLTLGQPKFSHATWWIKSGRASRRPSERQPEQAVDRPHEGSTGSKRA